MFLFLAGCVSLSTQQELRAPSLLPHTDRQMKTAGFWVSRNPGPDKIIMTSDGIIEFNRMIRDDQNLTENILSIGISYPGDRLSRELNESMANIRKQLFVRSNGVVVGNEFFSPIFENMNLESLSEKITVRYGLIVHYADQRILPTDEGLFAKAGDIDFDELQNSALDVGTPLVVLHESKDGLWVYGISELSSGWVRKEQVAFCDYQDFSDAIHKTDLAVVISPKADIYLNPEMTQYYDYLKMGSTLPVDIQNEGKGFVVLVPRKGEDSKVVWTKGYLKKDEVNLGFLPYTPRTIIDQAFKMLNAPYGWGDMYGEQDCSRFIQEIFATVGIKMPRNSAAQANVGKLLGDFSRKGTGEDKRDVLKNATSGISILYLKGHIMLYLGMLSDRPYAIHATWAYRQKGCDGQCVYVMNRVVVSDLSLGEGSVKGSLLERLLAVREIRSSQETKKYE